jgi:hypothetical protein
MIPKCSEYLSLIAVVQMKEAVPRKHAVKSFRQTEGPHIRHHRTLFGQAALKHPYHRRLQPTRHRLPRAGAKIDDPWITEKNATEFQPDSRAFEGTWHQ